MCSKRQKPFSSLLIINCYTSIATSRIWSSTRIITSISTLLRLLIFVDWMLMLLWGLIIKLAMLGGVFFGSSSFGSVSFQRG